MRLQCIPGDHDEEDEEEREEDEGLGEESEKLSGEGEGEETAQDTPGADMSGLQCLLKDSYVVQHYDTESEKAIRY